MAPGPHRVELTLASWNADHALDCVEPIPTRSVAPSFDAVVGAYTLTEGQDRIGGLYHVRCDASDKHLDAINFAPSPAVLDTRVVSFSHSNATDIVVLTACADGNLRCHDFPSLKTLWTFSHGTMITSLSVIAPSMKNASISVTFSDSAGGVALVVASRAGCSLIWASNCDTPVHSAEAWTVDSADASLLISGGDDGYLCATDLRTTSTAWKKRAHDSVGVTTVVHCDVELWTGGYDDHVRIWDHRKMRVPLAEKNLGGGVWRLKFHPRDPSTILAACMYDGFKVLERKSSNDDCIDIRTEYRKHESIAYGAAWLSNGNGTGNMSGSLALTASFYDKSLRLWNLAADSSTENAET